MENSQSKVTRMDLTASHDSESIPSPSVSVDSGFSEMSNFDTLLMPTIFEADELKANQTGSNGIPLAHNGTTGYNQVLSELEDLLMDISHQHPQQKRVSMEVDSEIRNAGLGANFFKDTEVSSESTRSSDKFKDFKFSQCIIKPAVIK